jgi:hypothetical protein
VLGFMAGGTAALVLSGTAETYLLPHAFGTNGLVGLIEEGGKGLVGLVGLAIASLVRPRVLRDGMSSGRRSAPCSRLSRAPATRTAG